MKQTADSVVSAVTSSAEYKNASVIIGFMPMADEVNIIPLMEQALKDGKKVAVPRMSASGNDMEFYFIEDLDCSFTTDNKYLSRIPDVQNKKLCGVCFTICVAKAVPMEENDIRVNYLLNEYGFIKLE